MCGGNFRLVCRHNSTLINATCWVFFQYFLMEISFLTIYANLFLLYAFAAGEKSVLDSVKGCRWVTLTAKLNGGEGTVAWQHTQLFRQELQGTEFPLQITIHLQNA